MAYKSLAVSASTSSFPSASLAVRRGMAREREEANEGGWKVQV